MQDPLPTKCVHNLIIVDESGSMSIIRKQAFTGMNETLQTVCQMQKKYPDQVQFVTLLTFDSGHTTWHYDDTAALKTKDLNWKAYNPCGGTPLYDAIGKGLSKVKAAIEREQNQACLDSAEREQARPKGNIIHSCLKQRNRILHYVIMVECQVWQIRQWPPICFGSIILACNGNRNIYNGEILYLYDKFLPGFFYLLPCH